MKKFIDVDPRLSEFDPETLAEVSVAIDVSIMEDRKHVAVLRKHEELTVMFADKIQEMEDRIERMKIFYTQIVNASAKQKYLKRVASN